jgi:hypothetical protein
MFWTFVVAAITFRVISSAWIAHADRAQTDNGAAFGGQFHWHVLDRAVRHIFIKPATNDYDKGRRPPRSPRTQPPSVAHERREWHLNSCVFRYGLCLRVAQCPCFRRSGGARDRSM